MSFFEHPDSIKLLRDLLKDPDAPSSDSEDDEPSIRTANFGPANIGSKATKPFKELPEKTAEKSPEIRKIPDQITDIEQWLAQQEKDDSLILENRKRPEYSIIYKQAVGTEDLFLQMGNRTAASMSCEDMVIKIQLPEETVGIEQMDLTVTEDEIDLQTPIYRLKLPLAQKIDPDKGKAKYDSDTKILILTLRMNRELDFVNF